MEKIFLKKQKNISKSIKFFEIIITILTVVTIAILILMVPTRIRNINSTFAHSLVEFEKYEVIKSPNTVKIAGLNIYLMDKNKTPDLISINDTDNTQNYMYVLSKDSQILKDRKEGFKGLYLDFGLVSTILLIMYGLFFYFYNVLIKNYVKIKTQLNDFKEALNNIDNVEQFKQNYGIINKKIALIPYLGDVWNEFCETLIVIRKSNSKEQNEHHINPIVSIENTVQAEQYINKETIINNQFEKDLIDAIPGILTGLGLLGTFSAITIALLGFNMDQIDVSIQNLLGGLSVKFISSLAGIATSIIFICAKSILFSNIEIQIAQVQGKLDKIFPRRTTESYLCSILQEVKIANIQQNMRSIEIAKEINTQANQMKQFLVAKQFASLLEETVSKTFSNAIFNFIENSIFDKLEYVKDEITKTINLLNTNLSNSISNKIKSQPQENQAPVVDEKIIENLKQTQTHLIDVLNELKKTNDLNSQALIKQLNESSNKISISTNALVETCKNIERMEHLK